MQEAAEEEERERLAAAAAADGKGQEEEEEEEEEEEAAAAGSASMAEECLAAAEVYAWEGRIAWDERAPPALPRAAGTGEADAGAWLADVAWDDAPPPASGRARRLVLDEADRDVAWQGRAVRRAAAGPSAALFAGIADPLERLSGDAWYSIQVRLFRVSFLCFCPTLFCRLFAAGLLGRGYWTGRRCRTRCRR